jgi:acyl dehydratase
MALLTDELRACIGQTRTYVAPEPLGAAAIRLFAMAVGDHNPIYYSDEAAARTHWGGRIAPPTLVVETNQYMTGEPDEAGYLGHTWSLPVGDMRLIRGGNEYEFFQPVRPDDVLHVTWRLADIYERETRRGPMLFVVSEVTFTNQRGERLAVHRETNIYQPRE